MHTRTFGLLFLSLATAAPLSAQGHLSCLPKIRNQANPFDCIDASRVPTLNSLYPITENLFVSPAGRIGFGTTSPTSHVVITNLGVGENTLQLALEDNCPNGAVIKLNNTDPLGGRDWVLASWGSAAVTPGTLTGKFAIFDNTVGVNRLVIDTTGRVGIGTVSPSEQLHVVGNLQVDGTICNTSGSITMCSDARFKMNVANLENALAKVLELRGVGFEWRRDEFPERGFNDARQVGFIAQEVMEVVPEIVVEGADGYFSVDYAKLTPLLVEAIRTQEEQLGELRRANEELGRKVARLDGVEARLERIEGAVAAVAGSK